MKDVNGAEPERLGRCVPCDLDQRMPARCRSPGGMEGEVDCKNGYQLADKQRWRCASRINCWPQKQGIDKPEWYEQDACIDTTEQKSAQVPIACKRNDIYELGNYDRPEIRIGLNGKCAEIAVAHWPSIACDSLFPIRTGSKLTASPVRLSATANDPYTVAIPPATCIRSPGILDQTRAATNVIRWSDRAPAQSHKPSSRHCGNEAALEAA